MSQKRVQSTINFVKPVTLTELYSFLGLVNYFRDHILQHSSVAHSLHNMVSDALDIQHYDAVIEYVPIEQNIPADVFSRLIPKPDEASLNPTTVAHKRKP